MSPHLLIECAHARPDRARVREAARAVSRWDSTLDQADRHGMAPLLYWCLERCPDVVPSAVLGRLRRSFHASAAQSLRLAGELIRLASLFDRAGISVVPFKGPALAWPLYETPALREMSDLDIMIQPYDLSRAMDLLISAGYQPLYPFDLRFFHPGCELPLVSASTGVALDLHWSLAPRQFSHGLDVAGVWRRLAPVQVAGRAFLTLGDEDLLIFLCVHGAKHAWCSLHWLSDLARLIDRAEIDWDGLIARVRARRTSRMVFAGLLLAVDVLGANVPEGIVARLRAHPTASAIAASVRQRLVADLPIPATQREHLRFQLGLLERAADRLRFCRGQLEPSVADRECLALPAPLFPLYYAFRPLRLLAKYTVLATRSVAAATSDEPSTSNSATPRKPVLGRPKKGGMLPETEPDRGHSPGWRLGTPSSGSGPSGPR